MRVELRSHCLDHLDLCAEGRAAILRLPHQRGILEVLGPDPGDQLTALTLADPVVHLLRQAHVSERQLHRVALTVAGMKFMAGEPMKPATKRFLGPL